MATANIIALAFVSLGFYVAGGLCIFKTKMLVGWAQRRYANSGEFVRAYPFSNIVMKSWYPVYIRCAGIFIWLWVLAIDYLVMFRGFR
jgi:hypothetical protein